VRERGAQWLREGDYDEAVGHIQRRLGEIKELADGELDRVRCEEREALSSTVEGKVGVRKGTQEC